MAVTPKTIDAELILRYSTGAERVLGAVTIEVDTHYSFDFSKTDTPLPPTAIKDSLARVEGAAQ